MLLVLLAATTSGGKSAHQHKLGDDGFQHGHGEDWSRF
jgi:hypothetical protein